MSKLDQHIAMQINLKKNNFECEKKLQCDNRYINFKNAM